MTFFALPLFLIPLVYGSVYNTSSQFEAYSAPPAPGFNSAGACGESWGRNGNWEAQSCCWTESGTVWGIPYTETKCQTCVTYWWPVFAYECGEVHTPFTTPGGSVTGPLGGAVGPVGPNIFPFDLRDILSLPENATYSVGVKHSPISDTIIIEIPKALSGSILNQSSVNRTATGLGYLPQPPMVPSK